MIEKIHCRNACYNAAVSKSQALENAERNKLKSKEDKTILTKYNQEIIIVNDEYAKIHIVSKKHGEFDVLFDIEDIEKVSEYKWCINGFRNTKSNCDYEKFYCVSNEGKFMHRILMDAKRNEFVDHIDHDGLNNRRNNMRTCSFSENRKNNPMYKNNKYGHIGVCKYNYNNMNKWMAHIMVDRKKKTLGYFDTYEEACKAREEAEIKYYGEFANTQDHKYI